MVDPVFEHRFGDPVIGSCLGNFCHLIIDRGIRSYGQDWMVYPVFCPGLRLRLWRVLLTGNGYEVFCPVLGDLVFWTRL